MRLNDEINGFNKNVNVDVKIFNTPLSENTKILKELNQENQKLLLEHIKPQNNNIFFEGYIQQGNWNSDARVFVAKIIINNAEIKISEYIPKDQKDLFSFINNIILKALSEKICIEICRRGLK